jgi:DNA-binding NarL/FixJ family response regulator
MGSWFLLAAILTASAACVSAVLAWVAERRARPLGVESAASEQARLSADESVVVNTILREQWKSLADQQRDVIASVQVSFQAATAAIEAAARNAARTQTPVETADVDAVRANLDSFRSVVVAFDHQLADLKSIDPPRLTARELEVLKLIADGMSSKAVAEEMLVSETTVRSHVQAILEKLSPPERPPSQWEKFADALSAAGSEAEERGSR